MRERRPRELRLGFRVAETIQTDGVMLKPDGTPIPMHDGAPLRLSDAFSELVYRGRNGRIKVIMRGPVDPASPSVDPNRHLLAYTDVFAIDTNTKVIRGIPTSVVAVYRCKLTETARGLDALAEVLGAAELHNVRGDPERVGWRLICHRMAEEPYFSTPKRRVGLIVDSALDSIQSINDRTAPVIDDWFLPKEITLIYASDAASDTVANRLIGDCHAVANTVLRIVEKQPSRNLFQAEPAEPFSHIANWQCTPGKSKRR